MVEKYTLKKLKPDEANIILGHQSGLPNRKITCIMSSGERIVKIPFKDVKRKDQLALGSLFENMQKAQKVIIEEDNEGLLVV